MTPFWVLAGRSRAWRVSAERSMKTEDAVEHLRQRVSGVVDAASAAPADIAVGADKNRAIGLQP
jgi:hypothetical protein